MDGNAGAASRTLPAADAEWFLDAFNDDIAFDRAILDACNEVVNVDQAFDMVDELAKQGDGVRLLAGIDDGWQDV